MKRLLGVALSVVAVVCTLAVVLVLRHDYWNWDTPYPLLFGFLPVGLWWQALVSICASIMMAMFVQFAWPQYLEDELEETQQAGADSRDDRSH